MVAAQPSVRPHPNAFDGVLDFEAREFDALDRDGSLARFLDALPDPATTKLYPEHIGDDVVNDAILNCAHDYFSLDERDARKVVETYEDMTPVRLHTVGLRTAPREVARIMATCAIRQRFGDQSGFLAPLWHDGDVMQLNTPPYGLLMPVRRKGLTRAWLNYKKPSDRDPRWVSSSHLPGGSKVVPSIHVVSPEHARTSGVVILTNNALEAEVLAHGASASVVGLNGVSPSSLVQQLREEWGGLRAVTLYLDTVNPFLTRALQMAGLKARCA
jgi:hypothetical protein